MSNDSAFSASGRFSTATAQSSRGGKFDSHHATLLPFAAKRTGTGAMLAALHHLDQLALEDLAAGGQRKLVEPMKYSGMSYFERPSRPRCAEQLIGRNARPMTARQTRSPSRSSATGKQATRATAGVPQRQSLDVRRIDVVAAADDEVLLAADDLEVAALVQQPRSPDMNQPSRLKLVSVAVWLSK